MLRVGAVDLGSNSVRLLIADISESGIHPITKKSVTTRLGHRVYESGSIVRESIDKTIETIMAYKAIMEDYVVDRSFGFATSAVRSASNGKEVIEYIEASTGIKIDILSGDDEAFLGYVGVKTFIEADKPLLVVDIGGGSTEMVLGFENELLLRESLDIGCVRLTERFIGEESRLQVSVEKAKELGDFVKKSFKGISDKILSMELDFKMVGIGGTAITLAALKHGLHGLEGSTLTLEDLEEFEGRIRIREPKLVEEITNLEKGRDDIILSGIVELQSIMKSLGKESIMVCSRDGLEGAVYYRVNSLE
jgi:exopolyphosphatase / guanosine-5'-triphosphate,3'-diphosphate pyrophosphatase